MLIQPDKNELGDIRLNEVEAVAKLREENKKLASVHRVPGQSLLEDHDMAVGNPMAPKEFVRRIQKINPNILVEKGGVPGAVAVRYVCADEEGILELRYVTGFYTDRVMTEFSSVVADGNGLATREVRGWRSVLLALLQCGALTYPQVKAAFGEPLGQRNSLWMQQNRDRR